jgi:hypothetical protein
MFLLRVSHADAGPQGLPASERSAPTARHAPRAYLRTIATGAMVVGLVLAACQPLPRPFQPDDKAELRALMRQVEVTDSGPDPAVVLAAVDGAPGDGDLKLSRAMRRALDEVGVLLVPVPDDSTPLLTGAVHLAPAAGNKRRVEIVWTLIRPDGSEVGRVGQADDLPQFQAEGDWTVLAQAIADAGAPAVLRLLHIAAGQQPPPAK